MAATVPDNTTRAAVSLLGPLDEEPSGSPPYAEDLHLQEVLQAMTAGRDEYHLEPAFWRRLQDPAVVTRRQEIFRDLEQPQVRAAVDAFAASMREAREEQAQAAKLYYPAQKQAWTLQAMTTYVAAADRLVKDLTAAAPGSAALRGVLAWLGATLEAEAFTTLRKDIVRVQRGLGSIRYAIRVRGLQVRVMRDEGGPDFSEEVTDTFARFAGARGSSYLVRLNEPIDMNHVEARILDGVAFLYPEPFADLKAFAVRYADGVDRGIRQLDRELQFFAGYLDLVEELSRTGLAFSYPTVSATDKETRADDTFDLALAIRRVREGRKLVTNDLILRGDERILVVSGPNQGGKTTLARTFGQLHHLAALGCPVPGRNTKLFLCDQLLTHFEREEVAQSLRGKLEDDLLRMRAILDQATPRSVVIMNEVFTSTTLHDARFLSREMLRRLVSLGVLGVCVTFLDELADTPTAVSMVSTVVPEDPAQRTFKVVRRPPDGLAYAAAIADKYGLGYTAIRERLDR